MKKRIDELYSVQRLRETWKQPGDTPGIRLQEAAPSDGLNEVMILFDRLSSIIHSRFKEDRTDALIMLLDQLRQLLVQRFDQSEGSQQPPVDPTVLNSAIGVVLNQIEDLTEAYGFK